MTQGTEESPDEAACLLGLPDDVLFAVLAHCDLASVGALARTCRRLRRLVSQDCVWVWMSRRLTLVSPVSTAHTNRRRSIGEKREQCRLALNWSRPHFRESRLLNMGLRQMPQLQLKDGNLHVTYKNCIRCYQTNANTGHMQEITTRMLHGSHNDISQFVHCGPRIVCSDVKGSITGFNPATGERLWHWRHCHLDDIPAIDVHEDVIVSGSKDYTVKLWRVPSDRDEGSSEATPRCLIPVDDRVWSLAINPAGGSFISGTAGMHHIPPIRLWDLDTGELISSLGTVYRVGAGVLDVQYETPHTVLTSGYDTLIRLWDLRMPCTQCVGKWMEPFDSTIYCVRPAGDNAFIAGTARHGLVRLWDKRSTKHVQLYYVGKGNSPVYSLALTPRHLYVALDWGIHLLDFSRY